MMANEWYVRVVTVSGREQRHGPIPMDYERGPKGRRQGRLSMLFDWAEGKSQVFMLPDPLILYHGQYVVQVAFEGDLPEEIVVATRRIGFSTR